MNEGRVISQLYEYFDYRKTYIDYITKLKVYEHVVNQGKPIKKELDFSKIRFSHLPRIYCNNGKSVSVQASYYHYCEPRNNLGNYYLIEAGFPDCIPPDSWFKYAEDFENPMETVYGYMPVGLVTEFVVANGGYNNDLIFKNLVKSIIYNGDRYGLL